VDLAIAVADLLSPPAAPILSVCVPTHHGRAREVGELIDRLTEQIGPELEGRIELCVSDGASFDDTQMVVERARERTGLVVRYRRDEQDRGFKANQLDSVAMASAPYCWLMSSDDAPAPGSLSRILAILEANPGVAGVSFGFEVMAKDLDEVVESNAHDVILPPQPERSRRLEDRADVVKELGLLFISLSTHVVDRGTWLAALRLRDERRRGPVQSISPHIQVLGAMLEVKPAWVWSGDRLLLMRTANDSWCASKFDNEMARYWCTFLPSLEKIYAEICGRWSRAYFANMAGLQRMAMGPGELMVLKMQDDPPPSLRRDAAMLLTFGRLFWFDPRFWRRSLPVLLTPHTVAPKAVPKLRRFMRV